MDRENILNEAKRCVCSDRNKKYGEPEDSFKNIADLWTPYLKKRFALYGEVMLTEEDAVNMMVLFKVARNISAIASSPDTYVDIAGYAACGGEIAGIRQQDQILSEFNTTLIDPNTDHAEAISV